MGINWKMQNNENGLNSDLYSLPNKVVHVIPVTMDAVNHLHVKTVALVTKCVTSEPDDSCAHARTVLWVTDVTNHYGHVTTSWCLGVTRMEFTKYSTKQTALSTCTVILIRNREQPGP